ncbi:hypothetical protein FIBSPDRAFT_871465 [Athelia psychrophila]|uniref:Uncharacterized protein n=1 Tax=Athelia psychrophila TaxID=1759441 RepID=A0A166A852_9AGAM|nr:hypothetical protein FIBSPDRAFT_871465 [Fibularhizoctonia sp. CBS 109695]
MPDEPEVGYSGVPRAENAAERREEGFEDGTEEDVEDESAERGEDNVVQGSDQSQ